MLSQRLFCHAHLLPWSPSTNGIAMFTQGANANSAIKVLLPMPQTQFKRNAPQFQRSISAGTALPLP